MSQDVSEALDIVGTAGHGAKFMVITLLLVQSRAILSNELATTLISSCCASRGRHGTVAMPDYQFIFVQPIIWARERYPRAVDAALHTDSVGRDYSTMLLSLFHAYIPNAVYL